MKKRLRWKVAQTAEMKWWENYLNGKDKVKYLEWKRGYWNRLIAQIEDVLPSEKGLDIIDAGCGPAGIFIVLNDHQVVAVDPLLNSYAQNLEHFNPEEYPYTSFHHSPIEVFEPKQQFDIVYCMNAINHVNDLSKSYDQIVNWAKPGGKIVVTIDAHNVGLFKHIFRLIPGDILHPHQYDLKEYTAMLTSRGCKILKVIKIKHEFFFDHYVMVGEKN